MAGTTDPAGSMRSKKLRWHEVHDLQKRSMRGRHERAQK
jgi:hypothetical protein